MRVRTRRRLRRSRGRRYGISCPIGAIDVQYRLMVVLEPST